MHPETLGKDRITRIIILGSCISRDIFFTYPDGFNVIDYFARTSIKSLISPSLFINEADVNLSSSFQRKMVARDFSKFFWERLNIHDYDYVLMDLIDERFDLIEYEGSFITKSSELDTSGYLKEKGEHIKIIPKKNYGVGLWGEDFTVFLAKIKEYIAPERILLLKAFWASDYKDENGTIATFSPQIGVEKINKQLAEYYNSIADMDPGIKMIDVPQPLADRRHRWGLTPYHYTDEWYLESKQKLQGQIDLLL